MFELMNTITGFMDMLPPGLVGVMGCVLLNPVYRNDEGETLACVQLDSSVYSASTKEEINFESLR